MQFLSYFPADTNISQIKLSSAPPSAGWLEELQAISRIPQLGIFSHDTRYHHPLLSPLAAVTLPSRSFIRFVTSDHFSQILIKVQSISNLEWQIVLPRTNILDESLQSSGGIRYGTAGVTIHYSVIIWISVVVISLNNSLLTGECHRSICRWKQKWYYEIFTLPCVQ